MIPLVIFDAEVSPALAELVRVHQHLAPGDVDCQWGQLHTAGKPVTLVLKFKRPMELMAVLAFELDKYGGFVDQIITAKTLYLQAGKEGDRLKYKIDEPKIYVEVPDINFKPIWDDLFYRSAFRRMKASGLGRQQAKRAAQQYIDEWRKLGLVRVGHP